MNVWLRHHAHSASQCVKRLAAAPLSSCLNVLVIGVALALPWGGYTLLDNLAGLVPASTARAEVSVFLSRSADKKDIDDVSAKLRAREGVKSVRFVSRDAALSSLKTSTGLGDVIQALRDNPLPDALIVELSRNDGDLADEVAGAARTLKPVEHAQVDSAWIRRLNAFLGVGRTAVLLLSAVLGLAVLAVAFNTIRLQVLTRRDEIEVSRLVGATDAYIRRPFLYLGGLQGALSGGAAIALVWAALSLLNRDVSTLASLYGTAFVLRLPEPWQCFALVLGSTVLGWLGAVISVSKYLGADPRQS